MDNNDKVESDMLKESGDRQVVRKGLLLLGSFCIAYLSAQYLHELSHAVAAYLAGGHAGSIHIHPFSWSYTYSFSYEHPVIVLSAGAVGSSLVSLLLYIVLIRWFRPILLPIVLIGPVSLLQNGSYWLVDFIQGSNGDACRLVRYGVPAAVVIVIGAVFLIIGIVSAVHLLCVLGLGNITFRNRLAILLIGLLTYEVAMISWQWIYNRHEFGLWLTYFASSAVLILIIAALGRYFRFNKQRLFKTNWASVFLVDLVGFGVVAALLMPVEHRMVNRKIDDFNVEIFETRPDVFPDVLTEYPSAKEMMYIVTTLKDSVYVYSLSYNYEEVEIPEKVLEFVTSSNSEHGYLRLGYDLKHPDKKLADDWQEESSVVESESWLMKVYKQQWIKLTPDVSVVYVNVRCSGEEGKFEEVFVMLDIIDWRDPEKVIEYAEKHPGVLDADEIERLKETSTAQDP